MKPVTWMSLGIVLVAVAVLAGCNRTESVVYGEPWSGGGRGQALARNSGAGAVETAYDIVALVADIPPAELSDAERAGLVYLREEEKLARDVYTALYETWNLPIFASIARSESEHMDSVLALLDRYGIADPVSDDRPGVFTDPDLAALYTQLVDRGNTSLADALAVGATIEDLDIRDLQDEIAASDNDDVRVVYQNLMKGSRNHIRSFVAQLARLDRTYEAHYITSEYLARILRIAREVAPVTDPEYVL